MNYYTNPFDALTESEITDVIRKELPHMPKNIGNQTYEEWVWAFVCAVKDIICYQQKHGYPTWPAEHIKRAFMAELFSAELGLTERMYFVRLHNRSYGGSRFPKDWPDTIAYTIDCIEDDLGGLPPLNPKLFKPSPRPSAFYPKLVVAVYMAGIFDRYFVFGVKAFAKRFGCSPKTVHKFLHKLIKLGYVGVVREGHFAFGQNGRCTLYILKDPPALLESFEFPDVQVRYKLLNHIASVHRQIDTNDWREFLIRKDWVKTNNLETRSPVDGGNNV